MIDTIIAVDENDNILGDFFYSCYEDLNDCFIANSIVVNLLKSNRLNDLSISLTMENMLNFIFVAYSHGGKSELTANGTSQYISNTINIDKFKNSFFYTCSCYTGKELGVNLIDNGCLGFIGYNNKFTVWDFYRSPFVECANYGLKLFVEGLKIDDLYRKMKDKYTEHIDNYNNDIFGAAMLVANRNALVKIGQNICIQDLLANN
jgi:hypothetical protein